MAPRQSYTHKNSRGPSSGRTLLRWSSSKNDELLLCIERALCDAGPNLATSILDTAGRYMSGNAQPTASAIHQHMIKLRNEREESGLPCVERHSSRKQKATEYAPLDDSFSPFNTPYPADAPTAGYALPPPPVAEMMKYSNTGLKMASFDESVAYGDNTPTGVEQSTYYTPPPPPPMPQQFLPPAPLLAPFESPYQAVPPPDGTINPALLSQSYQYGSHPPAAPPAPMMPVVDDFGGGGDVAGGGELTLGEDGLPVGDFFLYGSGNQ